MKYHKLLAATLAVASLAACSSDRTTAPAPAASLTIKGSASAPPATFSRLARQGLLFDGTSGYTVTPVGNPASVQIGMYALYLSRSGDCSSPVLAQDNGTAVVSDFAANPTLFSTTPDTGSYQCVILRMSDVIHYTSASASASCKTGTPYVTDIYREGSNDFLDLSLKPITATGTDSLPSDDKVFIYATTDTAAAMARGLSRGQVIPLASALKVPGAATFYWDGTNEVVDDGQSCGLNPPVLSFH